MKQSTLGLCPGGCYGGAPMALASPWGSPSRLAALVRRP